MIERTWSKEDIGGELLVPLESVEGARQTWRELPWKGGDNEVYGAQTRYSIRLEAMAHSNIDDRALRDDIRLYTEFALGRRVLDMSWSRLMQQYNLLAGNLGPIVPVLMLVGIPFMKHQEATT